MCYGITVSILMNWQTKTHYFILRNICTLYVLTYLLCRISTQVFSCVVPLCTLLTITAILQCVQVQVELEFKADFWLGS